MSLNGLEGEGLKEAYQLALREGGGWYVLMINRLKSTFTIAYGPFSRFLLKYISRDEVALLEKGTGGVGDIQSIIGNYDDASPLFGFIHYRRRKVVLKYVPKDTSRLLQGMEPIEHCNGPPTDTPPARLTVHFQSITEWLTPNDAVFNFSRPSELTDSALSATCSLHTAASNKPGTDPASSGALAGISEDASETQNQEKERASARGPEHQLSEDPAPLAVNEDDASHGTNQATAALKQADRTRSLSQTDKTLPPIPMHLQSKPEKPASIYDFGDFERRSSIDTRLSTQSARPSTRDVNRAYEYKPKVKLGPRPSTDSYAKLDHSNQGDGAFRPKATLPAGLRMPTRKTVPGPKPGLTASASPERSVLGRPIHNQRPMTADSVSHYQKYLANISVPPPEPRAPKMTPEKRRLMKALQIRQKHMEAQNASGSLGTAAENEIELGNKQDSSSLPKSDLPNGAQKETGSKNVNSSQIVKENVTEVQDSPNSIPETPDGPSTKASSVNDDEVGLTQKLPSLTKLAQINDESIAKRHGPTTDRDKSLHNREERLDSTSPQSNPNVSAIPPSLTPQQVLPATSTRSEEPSSVPAKLSRPNEHLLVNCPLDQQRDDYEKVEEPQPPPEEEKDFIGVTSAAPVDQLDTPFANPGFEKSTTVSSQQPEEVGLEDAYHTQGQEHSQKRTDISSGTVATTTEADDTKEGATVSPRSATVNGEAGKAEEDQVAVLQPDPLSVAPHSHEQAQLASPDSIEHSGAPLGIEKDASHSIDASRNLPPSEAPVTVSNEISQLEGAQLKSAPTPGGIISEDHDQNADYPKTMEKDQATQSPSEAKVPLSSLSWLSGSDDDESEDEQEPTTKPSVKDMNRSQEVDKPLTVKEPSPPSSVQKPSTDAETLAKPPILENTDMPVAKDKLEETQAEQKRSVDPVERVTTPEANDEQFLSDDQFMEELKSATVQEAMPISVSKSPIKPLLPRSESDSRALEISKSTRSTSSPFGLPSDSKDNANSPPRPARLTLRSISAISPPKSDSRPPISPQTSQAKKTGVSTGISQRIKALEKLSSRPGSPATPTNGTPTFLNFPKSPFRSASVASEFNNSSNGRSRPSSAYPSPSPSPDSMTPDPFNRSPKTPFESVSVTATIVRENRKGAHSPRDANPPAELNLHQSPIIVERQFTAIPKIEAVDPTPAAPLKPPHSKYSLYSSARSRSSSGTEQKSEMPQPARRSSFASKRSISSRNGSDLDLPTTASDKASNTTPNGTSEEKKASRSSRLMKRMSSVTSLTRKSLAPPVSPGPRTPSITEHQEPQPETGFGSLVDLGDISVQFPDNLVSIHAPWLWCIWTDEFSQLWKRRHVIVDAQGNLVLSPSAAEKVSESCEYAKTTAFLTSA